MSQPAIKRVCVFLGSSPGNSPIYARTAQELARLLASRGLELVYGGAQVGTMGILADEMLASGGKALGVIPRALASKEIAHEGLTELHIVSSMHERKQKMADLADAFIALPGGLGTLEELFEVLTWAQLGMHSKPCGLLNVRGFFDSLLAYVAATVERGFVKAEHRDMILVAESPVELLEQLQSYRAPVAEKWIDRDQT